MPNRNLSQINKYEFGPCHAFNDHDSASICEELKDLQYPDDPMAMKTREGDVKYLQDVEPSLLDLNKDNEFGGTLFTYTVKRSTKNGAQRGQKVVIYLHSQQILEAKDPKMFR